MNPEEKPGHMADIEHRVQETTKILSLIADAAENIVDRLHGPVKAVEASCESSPARYGSIHRIHQSIDTLNAVTERLERHVRTLTDL